MFFFIIKPIGRTENSPADSFVIFDTLFYQIKGSAVADPVLVLTFQLHADIFIQGESGEGKCQLQCITAACGAVDHFSAGVDPNFPDAPTGDPGTDGEDAFLCLGQRHFVTGKIVADADVRLLKAAGGDGVASTDGTDNTVPAGSFAL